MSNAFSSYQNKTGARLELSLDVDLKSEKIIDFKYSGELSSHYELELFELKNLVLEKSVKDALIINREHLKKQTTLANGKLAIIPLSLWLLHKAVEDYYGGNNHLPEQSDLICLCFGVSQKDLEKEILNRPDYDLAKLIAETKATSACGNCLKDIKKTMQEIREKNGLILGLDHSKSRFDNLGHWIKIKNLYPAQLLIKLDDLKSEWMKREKIVDQFEIEILNIEGFHLWVSIKSKKNAIESSDKLEKILHALGEFWQSEVGAFFFLHLEA